MSVVEEKPAMEPPEPVEQRLEPAGMGESQGKEQSGRPVPAIGPGGLQQMAATQDVPATQPPAQMTSKKEQVRQASPSRARAFMRRLLMLSGIIIVVFLSAVFWLRGGRIVVSDNAYIRSAKLMVSTDISGIVKSIEIRQGQKVEKNQVLFRLDPDQFQIALRAAEAQRNRVRMEIEASQRDYTRLLSDIGVQNVLVAQAGATFDRASALLKRRAGSQAAFDQTRYSLDAEKMKLRSLQLQAKVALTRLGGAADGDARKNPLWQEANAKVEEAKRQLARTIVRAPFTGVVTAVESLQPGTFLVAQTAALTNTGAVGLVSTDDVWIEANIKETDLTYVKTGNPVRITVDAYPEQTWEAKVETIFPATGSEFSILPAQNASGNWVKVVQRVTVRISIKRNPNGPALRAGMSVVVHIDTGHERTIRDLWRLVGLSKDPFPSLSAWAEPLLITRR